MANSWLIHSHSCLITKTPLLFPALSAVTLFAEHLTIVESFLISVVFFDFWKNFNILYCYSKYFLYFCIVFI